MKPCAYCGRPLETEDGPCARCDGAIDVDRVLGILGSARKTAPPAPAAKPAPPPPNRPPRRAWLAVAAAVGGAGALLAFRLATRTTPAPAPPPADPDAPLREARACLERARSLLSGDLPADFKPATDLLARAETELRRATALDPALVDVHLETARIHLARFRPDAAHAALDRALAARPDLETLVAKGELLLTAHLVYRIDRLTFPEIARGLISRLGPTLGPAFDRLASAFPPDSAGAALAAAYALAARSDFSRARTTLDAVRADALPSRRKDEVAVLKVVLDYLNDNRRSALVGALSLAGDAIPDDVGEREVWRALIGGMERRFLAPRAPEPTPRRHPVHAGLIRLEAWKLSAAGDDARAAARLGDALLSAPDYLPARYARAKLLDALKDRVQADAERAIAAKQARAFGIPEPR